jgi:hypothetical protein
MISCLGYLVFASAAAAGILAGCDDASTGPGSIPERMTFLEQIDHGCAGTRGASFDCAGEATLVGIEAHSDTITLRIRFEANCCPGFAESTQYNDGHLVIEVVDTLYACRCICSFENDFRFVCEGSGRIDLEFRSRTDKGTGYCVSGLDTTLSLP